MVPSRADPLRPLRAFSQVVRFGSVSLAARALGVTQPAVTLQLQSLARDHGVVLLERAGRRLVPTEAGEALLALAGPLVDAIDGLGDALQARLATGAGHALAIAAGAVALDVLLPPAVRGWQAGQERRLVVEPASAVDALGRVRSGEVALAVGSWLDVPHDIDLVPILEAPARLLVAEGHPAAQLDAPGPADLAGHVMVLPRGRSSTRQLVDLAFVRAGTRPPVVREPADWQAVRALVALGQGVTVTNALAAGSAPAPGTLARPLDPAFPPRPYGIAVRRGASRDAGVDRFVSLLRAGAPAVG